MRPAKADPRSVADALVTTFRGEGYAGASLADLAAATGLKSASLYHRFPAGKADMAAAALARAGEDFAPLVLAPLAGDGPPAARLAASAAGVARFYDDGRLACLLAVLALSDAPTSVRAAVGAMLAGWIDALAVTLGEAGAAAPRARAEDRIAAIQGALVLARAGGDTNAFARAVAQLGALP